jgi:hypothetical protein
MWGQPPRLSDRPKLDKRGGKVRSQKSEVVFAFSLQFRSNKKFLRRVVEVNAQHIRLAAHLAILDVALAASGRFVHGG